MASVGKLPDAAVELDAVVRDTVFAPIGGDGLVQQTVRRLGESIGMGLLAVGERLPNETTLAARLEISPMTLRQALAILRESGYIETTRGKGGGTFVKRAKPFPVPSDRQISAAELRDLTEYRAAVSGHAAELAASRATEADIERLVALVDEMDSKVSFSRFRQLDGRFHIGVAAAARSRRLTDAEAAIQRDLLPTLTLAGDDPARLSLESSNEQHRTIIAAISAGESDRARHEMQTHVRATADTLIGLRLGMID